MLISKGVQSLAGKTPEAYRAQMLLGRAITGGKAAIALWRDGQPALLQHGAEEIGMGRLGPGTVEGGFEFARVLLCMDWFIRLDSMFKDLDNGDREVTREEFFGGKGVQFWDRLGRLMQATCSLERRLVAPSPMPCQRDPRPPAQRRCRRGRLPSRRWMRSTRVYARPTARSPSTSSRAGR